jgi:hypothetical protein
MAAEKAAKPAQPKPAAFTPAAEHTQKETLSKAKERHGLYRDMHSNM